MNPAASFLPQVPSQARRHWRLVGSAFLPHLATSRLPVRRDGGQVPARQFSKNFADNRIQPFPTPVHSFRSFAAMERKRESFSDVGV